MGLKKLNLVWFKSVTAALSSSLSNWDASTASESGSKSSICLFTLVKYASYEIIGGAEGEGKSKNPL